MIAAPVSAKELIFGTGSGSKSKINIDAIVPFLKNTEKESNGSLTWKYLPGNQIVTVRSALKGLRDGLIDAGMVIPVFVRKDLINNNIVYDTIHLGHDDPIAAAGAAHETIMLNCPNCVAEYKKFNAFLLSSFAGASNVMVCRKPVKTLADIEGLKVRGGGAANRLVKALGGVPVGIPPQELALALERGGLDCSVQALNWMLSFGIHDIAKHVIDYPMGSSRGLGLIVMNRKTWKSLTKEQRKILWDNAPLASARAVVDSYVKFDDTYRKTIGPEKGVKFYKAGDDIKNAIAKMMTKEEAAIVAVIKKQGAKNPEKILAAFKSNLAKWRKFSQSEIKGDADAFGRVLKREVYDKLDPEKM
ncbi:MAG: C4-dicarboxylate TRAP transporter substrate-binding protein [Rhodospirillales bacterium]|nr:C4-dicarboxylate TRAP transporter substrate-binding protein [Rhodospirillales bacterium]